MKTDFIKLIRNAVNYWYLHLLTGLLFICVGVYALSVPAGTYLALSIIFTVTFLVSGLSDIAYSLGNRKEIDHWGWTLAGGVVTTLIGIMLFRNPLISMVTLPFYVGFMLLFRSAGAIAAAIEVKHYGVSAWKILLAIGILGITLSVILLWNPSEGGYALALWTGWAFIACGGSSIFLSLKLRKLKDLHGKVPNELRKKYEALQDEISKAMQE